MGRGFEPNFGFLRRLFWEGVSRDRDVQHRWIVVCHVTFRVIVPVFLSGQFAKSRSVVCLVVADLTASSIPAPQHWVSSHGMVFSVDGHFEDRFCSYVAWHCELTWFGSVWLLCVIVCWLLLHSCLQGDELWHFAGIWQKGFHDIFYDFAFVVIFGSYYFDLIELFAKWYGQLYHVSKSNLWVPPDDKNRNFSDKCMT